MTDEAVGAQGANTVPLTAFAEKPKRKKKAAKKARQPKLQKFDMVLMELLKEGKSGLEELMHGFNVHEEEFRKRLGTLTKRKMIVLDEQKREVKLSIKGFNEYNPKWKQAADVWLGRTEAQIDVKEKKSAEIVIEKPETEQKKLPVGEKIEIADEREASAQERMDLMDVIKKYGPTDKQAHFKQNKSPFLERHPEAKMQKTEKKTESKSVIPQVTELSPASKEVVTPTNGGENESCELCKSVFMVSVSPQQHNPKYGHCFCGAAYHKDCYDAILQGDRKCVRCGRKLVLAIDFKAEEAIGALKDVFE